MSGDPYIDALNEQYRDEQMREEGAREAQGRIAELEQELENSKADRAAYWSMHEIAGEWEARCEKLELVLREIEALLPLDDYDGSGNSVIRRLILSVKQKGNSND